ncbi:class I SAM-dependent methyltransferase [Aquihabitans sp. G128]|uniref:class I SAM-dependent methyltransferase n=1 Tax=Aquihabitans sp. G128 TaxID=2849779 RepID=UPI001C2107D8|nr:class I SAM-dependent methyltransferase [Aquihabitans sp. G128]QXC62203.1 class I SAM-dependent methyltransferase [Aquihabitans sp. G128]
MAAQDHEDQHEHEHQAAHEHGHVHLDEADWERWAGQAEREGEVLLDVVTKAASWASDLRGTAVGPVRHVVDVGSGPGVGSCELARLFPAATVTAVDGSPAMLERARGRAERLGLAERVTTHQAELPDGLEGLAPADLVWASMSLHHVGDEVAALAALRRLLAPGGLVAIAEIAEPLRVLPDDLGIGRPGLADRLDAAGSRWFDELRRGLPGAKAANSLPALVADAGLRIVGSRIAQVRLDPPLADDARRFVADTVDRSRQQWQRHLDADDVAALEVLVDPGDERSVLRRPDVFVHASRELVIAAPA